MTSLPLLLSNEALSTLIESSACNKPLDGFLLNKIGPRRAGGCNSGSSDARRFLLSVSPFADDVADVEGFVMGAFTGPVQAEPRTVNSFQIIWYVRTPPTSKLAARKEKKRSSAITKMTTAITHVQIQRHPGYNRIARLHRLCQVVDRHKKALFIVDTHLLWILATSFGDISIGSACVRWVKIQNLGDFYKSLQKCSLMQYILSTEILFAFAILFT